MSPSARFSPAGGVIVLVQTPVVDVGADDVGADDVGEDRATFWATGAATMLSRSSSADTVKASGIEWHIVG